MCRFISLLVPRRKRRADVSALADVAARHGFGWMVAEDSPIATHVDEDVTVVFTTPGHCDCGTLVGANARKEPPEKFARRVEKLRKKGWSETKIAAWVATQGDRRLVSHAATAPNELERWQRFIAELLATKDLTCVGLLLHVYRGRIDSEDVALRDTRTVALADFTDEWLSDVADDVLTRGTT